jgi:hypothetical protein
MIWLRCEKGHPAVGWREDGTNRIPSFRPVSYLPGLAFNLSPPNFILPSSWDYTCEPPAPCSMGFLEVLNVGWHQEARITFKVFGFGQLDEYDVGKAEVEVGFKRKSRSLRFVSPRWFSAQCYLKYGSFLGLLVTCLIRGKCRKCILNILKFLQHLDIAAAFFGLLVLLVLGFELKASDLLDRCSTTWATLLVLFLWWVFSR